ncbi:MAG: hypothetical protein CL454_00370 [Acidimicrobiaceae bacterium]|nr:hypothetical protein [Acidimicrobiaceae bacterium]|tara:strand:+ start:224 stop:505 length:282 start_codon:yes stop_codon:yes gene_type:complete
MNSSNLPSWAVVGADVRVGRAQWKRGNPLVWKQKGQITSIEKDALLTKMNRVGMDVYRILVRWPEGETASLLPMMLEPFVPSGSAEVVPSAEV